MRLFLDMESSPPDSTLLEGSSQSRRRKLKPFLTKQFYLWHWVSSAICLVSMLLFTITGFTLNHAGDLPAKPVTQEIKLTLPSSFLETIAPKNVEEALAPLPTALAAHLSSQLDEKVRGKKAEWNEDEIYLSLPRPGGDAWLTIDRESGEVLYEKTTRGTLSFLNDLHKGRHTGPVWSWFIDLFSLAALVFTLTGLVLLWVHAKRRPSTWPVVIAGLVLPLLLILFFIH